MKERKKCKKVSAPHTSRDIVPFQSQQFEQDGRYHFVDF